MAAGTKVPQLQIPVSELHFGISPGPPSACATGRCRSRRDALRHLPHRATGERPKSCTMIITEPNDFAAEVHDRMPMFLTGEQFAPWLSGQAGVEYLKPAPNDYLQRWPVSKRVISSKADADDPTLIEPIQLERLPKSSAD